MAMLNDAKITPADGLIEIFGKTYTITACINTADGRTIPVANIPVMSDDKWNELVAQAKAKHPELYGQAVRV